MLYIYIYILYIYIYIYNSTSKCSKPYLKKKPIAEHFCSGNANFCAGEAHTNVKDVWKI